MTFDELVEEVVNDTLKTDEPKNVLKIDYGEFQCPLCNNFVFQKYHSRFCGHCGQELDWSDVE